LSRFPGALLLAASLAVPATGAAGPAGQGDGPAPRLSLLDVPYLSQSEALCGGAAAAMVLRYWGARAVSPEDFAPLVERVKGGIETTVLARAIRDRGFQALAASGTPAVVQRELADGRPVLALIEDRPGAYHYVVIVGWHERIVALHDPARTPYVLMNPREFERRWSSSGRWMLAIAPDPSSSDRFRRPAWSPGSELDIRADGRSSCDTLIADGVRLAQANDLAAAERLLAGAAYQCPGAAPLRELAGVRLLQRRWPEVRDLAARAVGLDASDAHAWRLLATARYIEGDHAAALDAWNRAGEPRVDLVSVNGLLRTSHRAVERLLNIETGVVLTRGAAEKARRRLGELPAASSARLEYVPKAAGTAEVRAHVLERPVVPRGRLTWAAIGLRTAAARELELPLSSLGRGGERLDVAWRFWPNRPGARVALHAPTAFGLFSLDVASERQAFASTNLRDAERLVTRARVADWATPAVRWEARGGFARWEGADSFATVGGSARLERGRGLVGIDVDGWIGSRGFATGLLHGRWRSTTTRRGFAVDLNGVLESATAATPLDLWPAADTGHARRPLLRAHPVLDDGRLRLDRLGRRLAQATAEAQHWWAAFALPIGAATFVDLARTWRGPAIDGIRGRSGEVDLGVGFRLALPGARGTFRADLARGLRDGRTVFSIAWAAE
jgi:hypothetical protein